MLMRWAGKAGHAPLAGEPAMDTVRLDLANLGTHLAHHPQIAVLGRRRKSLKRKRSWRGQRESPTGAWSWLISSAARHIRRHELSIGVSIPLQWNRKNRQDPELASKLALVEQAKAERDEALHMHIATRSMIDEWQNGRERIARYRRELIPLANQRTAAALTAYRGGKAGLNEVLAARRNEPRCAPAGAATGSRYRPLVGTAEFPVS